MTTIQDASVAKPRSREWKAVVILILLIPVLWSPPFLFRSFLFQPFSIPSNSMRPTLVVGDYVLAAKYPYGYSRYALPYSPPLFSGRIFGAVPERGDIVVFRLPKDPSVDYVKRVVGLPGDRIQMRAGQLFINDEPVVRQRLRDSPDADACGLDPGAKVKRWRETLSSGVSYETYDCVDNGFYDNTNVYTVPEGHLFVLGDNRDNSTDSRVMSAVGFVPLENLIGRVGRIYWSVTEDGEPRMERFWTTVE
jgi:signal peptidase I